MNHQPSNLVDEVDENDVQHFLDHGYVILRRCIPRNECERFSEQVIQPTLARFNIFLNNPDSWCLENTNNFVMNEGSEDGVPFGVMVRNYEDGSDPISDSNEKQWPAFTDSSKLIKFLDYLHGSKCNWRWLHSENIGWIHLRFPVATNDSVFQPNWHVDGGHLKIHRLDSIEQSVVVLPMIQDVLKSGGNTILIPGSHLSIMHHLKEANEGISYHNLIKLSWKIANLANPSDKVVAAPCDAGDILVMHPFLVHAASGNCVGNHVRVSFNMGTRWIEKYPLLKTNRSVLENHILRNKINL